MTLACSGNGLVFGAGFFMYVLLPAALVFVCYDNVSHQCIGSFVDHMLT